MTVPFEPFHMERWQSAWEHAVAINLSESGVHPLSVRELLALDGADERALDALLAAPLGYPQTNGSEELRAAIAALHPGATVANVVVATGCAEANFVACWGLLGPRAAAVVQTPNYAQVAPLARAWAGAVHAWPLAIRNDSFAVDLDALRRLVNRNTKLIALCNPNNPTGLRLPAAALDEIGRIADAAGAWVLSDEVYRGAEVDGVETPTMWGRAERVIITSGLSKAYGLPGLRVGWLVAPADAAASLWGRRDYTTIAPGFLSDRLARVALAQRPRVLARTRAIVRENLAVVERWAAQQAARVSLFRPEAGAIACVRVRQRVESAALAERLRVEKDVLVVPGGQLGLEPDGFLRIGFGGPRDALEQGLARIASLLGAV